MIPSALRAIARRFYHRFDGAARTRDGYYAAIGRLWSATLSVQALSLITAPLLSRLYIPADFGVFAIYNAALSLVGSLAALRLEPAILLPREDHDGFSIVIGCIGLSLITAFATLLSILLLPDVLSQVVGMHLDRMSLALLPIGIILATVGNVLTVWLTRRRRYADLARNRVVSYLFMTVVHVGLGFLGLGALGLFLGYLIGELFRLGLLFHVTFRDWSIATLPGTARRTAEVLRRYAKFSAYNLISGSVNVFTMQLLTIVLGRSFGTSATGQYAQCERFLGLPARLLGNSVADVFRQQASTDYAKRGECMNVFRRTFWILSFISLIPAVVLVVWAPSLFAFALGEQWRTAGEYARIMAPLLALRLVVSTLSGVILIAHQFKFDLVWQVGLLGVVWFACTIGIGEPTPHRLLIYYTAGYSAMYLVYLYMSYLFARGHRMLGDSAPA
jgi:O-antigen/teichoic acid export membrane protein